MKDKTNDAGSASLLNLIDVFGAVLDRLREKIASGEIKEVTKEQAKLVAAISLVVLDINDSFELYPVNDPFDLDKLEEAVKRETTR